MFPNFDPSKMDPKVLMELSRLVRELPPSQLNRMQSIMHNMMAGYDVRQELEEFEKTLPPGFREKIMTVMGPQMGAGAVTPPYTGPQIVPSEPVVESSMTTVSAEDMNLREARMTVLRAVADGGMAPEDAERVLFPDSET